MRAVVSVAALLSFFWLFPVAHPQAARARGAAQKAAAKHSADAEAALEKAFAASGEDRAALVKNLQHYLEEFPNAPRKPDVYRALVDACQHLRNDSCVLDYAERLIAIQPDDSDMMIVAVSYLQEKGDDESLARASDYVTRVIDRVEKSLPPEHPSGKTLAQWKAHKRNLRGVLYFLRGQVRYSRHDYDAAAEDLQTSYSIRPSAGTADLLGQIAELQGDSRKAIDEYALAFVLPDPGPAGKIDRDDIRKRLGNAWREVHGSDRGLGDEILAAYDRVSSHPGTASKNAEVDAANKRAGSVLGFTLQRPGGTPIALSALKGKIIVLDFWAPWCVPCAQINAQFDRLASAWSGDARIAFLMVDTDAADSSSSSSAKKQNWHVPVVHSEGLDRFLNVRAIPAAVIVGPSGRIVYDIENPAAAGFSAAITSAIQRSLGANHRTGD